MVFLITASHVIAVMDEQKLYLLLRKHSQGTCTAEELAALEDWYRAMGQQLPEQAITPGSEAAQQLTQQKLSELRARIANAGNATSLKAVKTGSWRKVLRYAALWAGVLLLGAAGYYLLNPRNTGSHKSDTAYVSELKNFNRFITLPDGSIVILHAGSKLEYPTAFTGKTREVFLSGEAYFDIKHDSLKAFIINTGKVKTTVLGTAFNIKAYPDLPEITVSVTRGKVKVEDDKAVLGVLTPDQQIVYNTKNATALQQKVNAAVKSNWTMSNMIFENVTFETIAVNLGKRYDVNIQFSNESLKQCPVTASFTGTEPLKEVLDVICQVRNATYTIENGHNVLIRGKGCNL